MCGIAGIFEFGRDARAETVVLRRMCEVISHRGPDDQGVYAQGPVGIGMRRLSIVDLATGHQPISNEDGSIWIVFNGEIYNHSELRERLIARGHSYRTHSDTETIVHLYEEYGHDCVQHLRGMFAFAIWDTRQRKLFIARDRLGIKPLYYQLTPIDWFSVLRSRCCLSIHPCTRSFGVLRCPSFWLSAISLAQRPFTKISTN